MFLLFAFIAGLVKSPGWAALWILLHWLSHNCSGNCTRRHVN